MTAKNNHTSLRQMISPSAFLKQKSIDPAAKEPEWNSKKIVVVGDRSCGKTSLIMQFSMGTFPKISDPVNTEPNKINNLNETSSYGIVARIGGELLSATFWDTDSGGGTEFLRAQCYKKADCVMLIFSLVCPQALVRIEKQWMREIREYCKTNVPVILVGNKVDLRDVANTRIKNLQKNLPHLTKDEAEGLGYISKSSGIQCQKKIGARDYIECSAKKFYKVNETFEKALCLSLDDKNRFNSINCILL